MHFLFFKGNILVDANICNSISQYHYFFYVMFVAKEDEKKGKFGPKSERFLVGI